MPLLEVYPTSLWPDRSVGRSVCHNFLKGRERLSLSSTSSLNSFPPHTLTSFVRHRWHEACFYIAMYKKTRLSYVVVMLWKLTSKKYLGLRDAVVTDGPRVQVRREWGRLLVLVTLRIRKKHWFFHLPLFVCRLRVFDMNRRTFAP